MKQDKLILTEALLRQRRNFLQQTSAGLSALALSSILGADGFAAEGNRLDPPQPTSRIVERRSI